MTLLHVGTRPFTVDEYQEMLRCGILADGERVELIEGAVTPLAPHNPEHSKGVAWSNRTLTSAYNATHFVRVQLPIEVTSISEPEPDFSLITPEDLARARRHPTCAPLVVEVANTSLDYDRTEKASLYARAGVPEYWILNVRDRQLEVHLDPAPNPKGFFGYAYASVTILGPDELVTASFLPPIPIRVLDLLGT